MKNILKKPVDVKYNGKEMDVVIMDDGFLLKALKGLKKNWFQILVSLSSIVAAVFSALAYFKM